MKTQSAKAKGRRLQQWVRDRILAAYPGLSARDVVSTSMGAGGVDVKLSEKAFSGFPYSIECKNKASFAVYKDYKQACEHSNGDGGIPLLVIKANGENPLVVMDAAHFIEMNAMFRRNSDV